MKRFILVCMLFFAGIAVSAQQRPQFTQVLRDFIRVDDPVVVLHNVRVIDGTGAPARENQTIVIAQGKIAAMGDARSIVIPSGAKVLDLAGYSVMPGIVGMHNHMHYPAPGGAPSLYPVHATSFPRLYLAGGVTTIRTTGSMESYTDFEIKKMIEQGRIAGPKMHLSGPYFEGSGSFTPQMRELKDAEDARKMAEYWLDLGVTSLKAFMHITPAQLSEVVKAAHARNAKVTGHLCSIGFREAAAMGIDNLEHGFIVDTEFFSGKQPGICPNVQAAARELAENVEVSSAPVQEMIRDLVAKKVAITSTLPVFEAMVPGRPRLSRRMLDAMTPDARVAYLSSRAAIADTAAQSFWPALFKKEMQFELEFARAGGVLLAGLDPTGNGAVIPGFGDQRGVQLLVEAGFTPLEAIRIATLNGAQFLGEAERIGSLAVGKAADIVVIKGDPSKDIADIEKVEMVFKDGIGFDSAKLIDSVKGLVGLR